MATARCLKASHATVGIILHSTAESVKPSASVEPNSTLVSNVAHFCCVKTKLNYLNTTGQDRDVFSGHKYSPKACIFNVCTSEHIVKFE